ncbi:hypothetical protein [Mesorhizobium sp. B1-1-8]|uniref:hypothetical protein n=1 Tax=Mesorhizobium sp. B1-1-8 TaxID=2589976 RepID=UPI0015E3777D|nr:hypothetical protein [Mesorhizobium sp. B1-1-8]UCI09550.1 hypothetical protein FJ974_11070 [Mesorhizobium sp. B1-1-8]
MEEIDEPVNQPHAAGDEVYCFPQKCTVIGFKEAGATYDPSANLPCRAEDVFSH